MDLTNPPSKYDIKVMMKSASFWPKVADGSPKDLLALEQAEIGVASANEEWQRRTGWYPFHSPASAAPLENALLVPYSVAARDFIQHGVLPLDNGILRLDEVTVNGTVVPSNASVLRPSHAPSRGRPYSWLYFPLHRHYAHYDSRFPLNISVKGRWGFCTVYPADAWQQIVQAGALIALCGVENLQNIASIGQDGFNKAFDIVGVISQKDILTTWGRNFPQAAERYKRST